MGTTAQVIILSFITGAFFWKDRLHQNTVNNGTTYYGLLCELPAFAFSGFPGHCHSRRCADSCVPCSLRPPADAI